MKILNNSCFLIISLTVLLLGCKKINLQKEESDSDTNEDIIYDIEWERRLSDGEWIKLTPMFDTAGLYLSDTLFVKTIPDGGKVRWSIESIEGSLPSLDYPVGQFDIINTAIRPLFSSKQLWEDEYNTSGKWRIIATVNKGTEHEKSITAEYYHERTPSTLEYSTFMYTELEDCDSYISASTPIIMKLGDSLKILTAKIPKDHRGRQCLSSWPWDCSPSRLDDMNNNDIYEVSISQLGNHGIIKAIGVGEIFSQRLAREIIVTP